MEKDLRVEIRTGFADEGEHVEQVHAAARRNGVLESASCVSEVVAWLVVSRGSSYECARGARVVASIAAVTAGGGGGRHSRGCGRGRFLFRMLSVMYSREEIPELHSEMGRRQLTVTVTVVPEPPEPPPPPPPPRAALIAGLAMATAKRKGAMMVANCILMAV